MHVGGMRGEEHRGLPGRIAAADDDGFAPLAQFGLDRRGPIEHAAAFMALQVFDFRMAIHGAAGDHDRARGDARAVGKFQQHRRFAAMQSAYLGRNGDVRAELLRLCESAARQRLAGDAGGEPEIVFDA